MAKQPAKVLITQTKTVHMYAELWHASKCVLERGIENEKGSSWQFLSSIVLTAFAFEAYLNHVGTELLTCWQSVEPLPPPKKFELIREMTEQIEAKPAICDAEHVDARLGQRPLAEWEKLIETKEFAERARTDIEEILNAIHAARPDPKEWLFSFGIGSGSAVLVDKGDH